MFHVWYMTYRLNHLQQLNGSKTGVSSSTAVRLNYAKGCARGSGVLRSTTVRLNYAKGTRASELSSSIALCLNYAKSIAFKIGARCAAV